MEQFSLATEDMIMRLPALQRVAQQITGDY